MHTLKRFLPGYDRGPADAGSRLPEVEVRHGISADVARRKDADPFDAVRRRLAAAFTPTRPITNRSFFDDSTGGNAFVGREAELTRMLTALLEDQAHVVLFGDRGRGKTSLANLVVGKVQAAGFEVARCVCSATSDYDSIMRNLFRNLPRWVGSTDGPEDTRPDAATALLPTQPLQPGNILTVLGNLQWSRLIFVIDEFDRVTGEDTRTAIADMIKQLSDRGMPLLFLIIGVSDSFEELFGRHPSIQRCVTRVALPLLKQDEIRRIIAGGARRAGMQFPELVHDCIAELARGVPYVAQLLSLRAGQAALQQKRLEIRGCDLIAAISSAAVEADPRVLLLYESMTRAETDSAVLRVLRAAAAGTQDSFGCFRVVRDADGLRVGGVAVDPAAWQRVVETGAIRQSGGGKPEVFLFNEVMLPHLVLQRAVLRQLALAEPG